MAVASESRVLFGMKSPQIDKQFLGVGQGLVGRRLEPAKPAQVGDARGFEGQHDFGEIEAFDFGQFMGRTFPMFLRRPQPGARARGGAASTAGALV